MAVDLNVDLGELENEPEGLYALATVVNIACGGHAGDSSSMSRALELSTRGGARVAAHPGYADREGFGRRPHFTSTTITARAVAGQCAELARLARDQDVAVSILKLHGALYHDASIDEALAAAVVDAARFSLPRLSTIVGPARSMLERSALARRLHFAAEGFADRRYAANGKLVARSEPGAVLTDVAEVVEQALRLARAGEVETICLHGDTPGAELFLARVRDELVRAGFLAENVSSGAL